MQLVWQQKGRLRVLDLRERSAMLVVGSLAASVAIALLAVGVTFVLMTVGFVPESRLAAAERRVAAAEARLEKDEERLGAYAARLSRMQAHIVRLDALGQQLTEMAGIDPEDFSFDRPPPLGGRAPGAAVPRVSSSGIEAFLSGLADAIDGKETEITQLADLLMRRQLRAQVRPEGNPVRNGYVSSHFGRRTDPFTGQTVHHKGIDYAGREGSEVVAVADGIVSMSRRYGGFGNIIEITHGHGFMTRYAHNKENLVSVGERVRRGDVIALMGTTGRATGPNLHFEVLQDGKPVDPVSVISGQDL